VLKRGRPPLPLSERKSAVRIVFYASMDEWHAMRDYAASEAETIQKITRKCWRKVIAHAQQTGKIDFHGAVKNT
jgi:hypothetical protein